MDLAAREVGLAIRRLCRQPTTTSVAILTLASGIAAVTIVFGLADATSLRSLPFVAPQTLVDIRNDPPETPPDRRGGYTSPLSAFEVWRAQQRSLEGLAAYEGFQPILTGLGEPERIAAWAVSSNFFDLLGVRPLLGRVFRRDEELPGSAPIAILSHQFWVARMGGDSSVIGRTFTLDEGAYEVVGIMPATMRFPSGVSLWASIGSFLTGPDADKHRRAYGAFVVARMRPQQSLESVRRDLERGSRSLWALDPGYRGWLPSVAPLVESLTGEIQKRLGLLVAVASAVLLVAWANVANITISRALARQSEIAIRAALGATRIRIVSHFLLEACLLAAVSGALAAVMAHWGLTLVRSFARAEIPEMADLAINGRALIFSFGTSLAIGVALGVIVGFRASGATSRDSLRLRGVAGLPTMAAARLSDALLVGQVALTMVLLIAAGLLANSFLRVLSADRGFVADRVLQAQLEFSSQRYGTPAQRVAFTRLVLDRLHSTAGVDAAAFATGIPLALGAFGPIGIDGDPARPDGMPTFFSAVTPQYFELLRIAIRRGRALSDSTADNSDEIVVNDQFVRTFLQSRDPIGVRVSYWSGARVGRIVGVVSNTPQPGLDGPPVPQLYEPFARGTLPTVRLVVRTRGDPAAVIPTIRRVIRDADPAQPVDRLARMSDTMKTSTDRRQFYLLLASCCSLLAIVMSASGLYALVSDIVSRRRREIGVRIALGARAGSLVVAVVGRSLLITLMGVALGGLGAVAVSGVLRDMLFETRLGDPRVYVPVIATLFAVSIAASLGPALRAMRVDPVTALRTE